jgi:hypothetical protein
MAQAGAEHTQLQLQHSHLLKQHPQRVATAPLSTCVSRADALGFPLLALTSWWRCSGPEYAPLHAVWREVCGARQRLGDLDRQCGRLADQQLLAEDTDTAGSHCSPVRVYMLCARSPERQTEAVKAACCSVLCLTCAAVRAFHEALLGDQTTAGYSHVRAEGSRVQFAATCSMHTALWAVTEACMQCIG